MGVKQEKANEQMVWLIDHLLEIFKEAYPKSDYFNINWMRDEESESLCLKNCYWEEDKNNPLHIYLNSKREEE